MKRRVLRRLRYRSGKIGVLLGGLFVVSMVLVLLFLVRLRPALADYGENYVQYQATTIMEQAVAACAQDMEDMGMIQTNSGGGVTAVTTNAAQLNVLRTKIVQKVYDEIGALEQAHSTVALGTLIDPQYLAGLGPEIPFGVVSLGCVTAETLSDFSQAGVNQTLHTVSIRVNADFTLRLTGFRKDIRVSAEYPLEETIIVGDVPMIAAASQGN